MTDDAWPKTAEKRGYARQACQISIDFYTSHHAFRENVRDISMGGVFVETCETFKEGDCLMLAIPYGELRTSLEFKGRVVRVEDKGVGIEFDDLTEFQRQIIVEFLKELNGVRDVRYED